MKKLRLVSLILGLLISCSLSSKAQLLIENFDYPVGDSLGQHGWTGHGGTTMLNIIADNQTYTNYFPSVGNQVYIGTSSNDLSRGFTAVTSGNLYCAFVINVDTAKTTPDYFFHTYSTGAGSSFLNRIYVKDNGDGTVKFGIQKGTTPNGGSAVWTTSSYPKDVPHLVVLKVEIVSGTTNDIPSIFVDPVLNGIEPTADAIATDLTSADYASIDRVAIRQGTANSPGAYFDGLRVATTWADAVMAPAISTATDILTFDLTTPAVTGTVNATAHTVALNVPFGTAITALVPTFTLSAGATAKVGTVAQVSGTTANDFTSAVVYDVTAEDGTTTQAWTITVTVAAGSTATDIITFNLTTPATTGTVDLSTHTVVLNVPAGTNVTALVPTFTLSAGATAKVGTVAQVSGITANDFTSAVTYDVTAEDGITTQAWTVTVNVTAGSTATDILTFDLTTPAVTGTVNATAHTVALNVPFGTAITALVPTFTLSAGATAKVGTVAQVSGTTANDFTSAVTYDVTAEDGITTQAWTVTVNVTAGSTATDILTFDLTTPAVTGTVNATAHTVALNVPFGTAITALVPTFTLSAGATAKVGTVAQVSGTTANDFTSAVVYDVTAEDGTTTQAWTITVTVAAGSTATDIITFNLTTPATTGTVDLSTHTVVLNVPAGTNVTALVPTFTLSAGATAKVGTVAQVSGITANDFTSAVTYDVTAEDGITTQAWTVTVNVAVQTYTVTFSVVGANGTLAATVDAAAITSPAAVEAGKNVIFTATPAANYVVKEWKLNGTVVPGNTTNTYTLTSLTAAATVTVEFKLNVGISETTENVASIYPNPANNVVNIKMNNTISKIEVVSPNGQIVAESVLNNNEGSINISTIANGMYFLRIETANGITMNKIQIAR